MIEILRGIFKQAGFYESTCQRCGMVMEDFEPQPEVVICGYCKLGDERLAKMQASGKVQ